MRADVGRAGAAGVGARTTGGGLLCFTAGVWGEPAAYRFGAAQLAEHWFGAVEPLDGGVTLLAGEAATAPGLRCALQVLAAGGQLVTAARWAPARVARRLRQGGVDRLWAAGGQLNQLAVRLSAAGPQRYGAMRRIDAPGGPVHRRAADCFEALFGAPVLSCYAVTEAGGPATSGASRAGADHRPFDVGGTRAGLDVDVIGPDGARRRGDEPGDLHLRGAALGREARTGERPAPSWARAPLRGATTGAGPRPRGRSRPATGATSTATGTST